MEREWIWINKECGVENERACFFTEFETENPEKELKIKICAVSRYILYVNGQEIGRGPIRSGKSEHFLDTYSLVSGLRKGKNQLAVRVWNYGWSTYQTRWQEPGLVFEAVQEGKVVSSSDSDVFCEWDMGHSSHTVKRNVNLGFSDSYDARKFDALWMEKPEPYRKWGKAVKVKREKGVLKDNPLRQMNYLDVRPAQVLRVQDVEKGCQQVSVNTRRAFFGGRRDADETIFSGFLGCILEVPEDMNGMINFPNRTWNGILGDFRIGEKVYEVSNEHREIPVSLKAGKQLLLLQISGKYDDLYCHMEFEFPKKVIFCKSEGGNIFFAAGPTNRIIPAIDGISKVYGGLDEYNRMTEYSKEHDRIWKSPSENVKEEAKGILKWIEKKDIRFDEYILSMVRNDRIKADYTVSPEHLGILWDNQETAVLLPPVYGDGKRIIVDFKDIYVGSPEFTIYAPEGTILEIYGFENMYHGEIDYTIGLNNSMRYVCKKGWQTYKSMVRMGMRYAVLTFRNCREEIKIRDFHIRHSAYAASNTGDFMCDDYLLNRIWQMSRRTHELCMEDSFTDCPTYEQAFWIGDAGISSMINMYLFGEYDFVLHNIRLAVTARENTELFNALTPTDWNTSIPMWTMNWIISVREFVRLTGNWNIAEELYDVIRSTLMHYSRFIKEDGGFLINGWNMIDWADMDIKNHGIVTAQQGLLAYCFRIGVEFANYLGKTDQEIFKGYERKLLEYIDTCLWKEDKQMFIDGWSPDHGDSKTVSIQTHTLLYLYDAILDEKKRKIVTAYLEKQPREFVSVGSPFMLYYLHETWAERGETEKVLEDIKNRWGEMLSYDSTTCWEVFPGFYEVSRTRSYCHSWSASPAYFMIRYVLGVERVEEGFGKIRLNVPKTSLRWSRGTLPTPKGPVHVEWEKKGNSGEYRLRLPENMEVEVKEDFPFKLIVEKQQVWNKIEYH